MNNQKTTKSESDARALTEEIERATANEAEMMEAAETGAAGAAEMTEAAGERGVGQIGRRIQNARLGNVATGLPTEGEVGTRVDRLLNEQLGDFDDQSDDLEVVGGGWSEKAGEMGNDWVADNSELARDEQELTEADNFVGAESRRQTEERLRDDYVDYLTEIKKGTPWETRIMTANTERLTGETVTAVDNLIKSEAVHPAKLEHLKHKMTVALLKDAYGRNFGDRN